MELNEAIKANYLVNGLSDENKARIIEIAEVRAFEGGSTIVRQFDRNSDLMIVLEGAARVNTFSGDLIAELGPGSVIGEISLIDDQPRSATVTSAGGTTVAVISSYKLKELMKEHPEIELVILRNLSKILCARLRMMNVHLDGLLARR